MRVLVTGATGFIGQALCERLSAAGHDVRAAVRTPGAESPDTWDTVAVGDIGSRTVWDDALPGIDTVIHAAARVHVMRDTADASALFFETNTSGTRRLAEACAAHGVRRLIFVSSIKVNGEGRQQPYTAEDIPDPQDAYGRSKLEAERALMSVAHSAGLEAVIVRLPLVYGPRVRANFLRLLRWVDRQIPLPLARVRNLRSLVSLANVCSFLEHVLDHPGAAGRVWLVADGEDISTPDLVRRVAHLMKRKSRLLKVPVWALHAAGVLTGRSAEISRLCGSLRLDVTPARIQLGWSPPYSMDACLAQTVEWYLREVRSLVR